MIRYLSRIDLRKFRGKTCLLRIDLNIEPGAPLDSYRLQAVIPTIRLLLKNKIKIVILSHRGRPKLAKRAISNFQFLISKHERSLSLKPFAQILTKKVNTKVQFIPNFNFPQIKSQIDKSKPGSIFLLENLRFLPGEDKNDAKLAKQLASLGDFYPHTKRGARSLYKNSSFGVGVYVNDAFAVSHRKNASLVAITKSLPSYGGLLLEKEIKNLDGILKYTISPLVIILGGAKIREKIFDLRKIIQKADYTLLGSNAFNESIQNSSKLTWPEDGKKYGKSIWDIGPFTINCYASIIGRAKTIIWNGPPGFFEKKGFEKGTVGIWKAVLANKKAHIVIGGGETVASAKLISNFEFRISNLRNVYISTGGGAMLEYLSGKKLPGIEALK